MTFGERLTLLRKENGYNNRTDLAEKLNIPSTTLRNYETDKREPGHKFLKQISTFFNVSVDYLLCLTDNKEIANNNVMSLTEIQFVKKYRLLDDYGKKSINDLLNTEYARCTSNEYEAKIIKIIPLADFSLSAGIGNELLDNTYEMIEVDGNKYPKADIAFRIKGDSMEPKYHDNDLVYVQKNINVEIGEIGAFLYNNKQYIKKLVFENNAYKLRSLNKENYEDIIINNSSLITYGKIIN